ncbi:MAG: DUF1573 domain-containing protein [Planctomycetaceae bacterium]|nr:DUF1573 domain-containing protein [Planctomycetales bacterium]MCB9873028.1 DUF1573 domain-containing protein [Planctomycetaceae bacterium]MCB9937021.1 DUF1573 domain-containing protein [Planctomycetaceae bacterium]
MIRQTIIRALLLVLALLAGSPELSAQEWAKKMFKTTSHDFGSVARGAKAEFSFEFENLYEEDLHVASVRSSCGCTTPTITKRDLKTFEKSQIVATYNTRSFLGQKGATVTVVIDKPYYAEVQLSVEGYIRSDVVFDPGEVNFGEVEQYNAAEKKLTVTYAGRSDWKITDVRSANEHFEVELAEKERSGGRVAYDMIVRLTNGAPSGYFQDQLNIITDDSGSKSIPVLVQGSVVSPLTVSPASLILGTLEPGQIVKKQLIVRGNRPFRILRIECSDGCFSFDPPGQEPKQLHFIPVTFTADASGVVSQSITIQTDLGNGAIASCVAAGTVRDSAGAE